MKLRDNHLVTNGNNSNVMFNSTPKRWYWFRLLTDTKNEVNTFKIKKNKTIYFFTKLVVFLLYLLPILFLITGFVISLVHIAPIKIGGTDWLGKPLVFDAYVIRLIVLGALVISSMLLSIINVCVCGNWFLRSYSVVTNLGHLVHSKYLVDKYLYFYDVNLSDFSMDLVKGKSDSPLSIVRYLKEKDISELVIDENIKNSGKISKVYAQDKEKAINLMKLNIKVFFYLTKYFIIYDFVMCIPIFVLLAITSTNMTSI